MDGIDGLQESGDLSLAHSLPTRTPGGENTLMLRTLVRYEIRFFSEFRGGWYGGSLAVAVKYGERDVVGIKRSFQ
jgi:hypothetical protein